MRLVASYHGVCEITEFENRWSDVHEWYERATLPIEMGGMAIRNMGTGLSTSPLVLLVIALWSRQQNAFHVWQCLKEDWGFFFSFISFTFFLLFNSIFFNLFLLFLRLSWTSDSDFLAASLLVTLLMNSPEDCRSWLLGHQGTASLIYDYSVCIWLV